MHFADLVEEAVRALPEFIVATGGEPAVHDWEALCNLAREHSLGVHLETSGAFPIKGVFDWITVSPKRWRMPLPEVLLGADELKIIVEDPKDVDWYFDSMLKLGWHPCGPEQPIWLHPEWSHRNDPQVLEAICRAVRVGCGTYRAGWQLHKLYRVDQLDARIQDPVPLGGNEMKGY